MENSPSFSKKSPPFFNNNNNLSNCLASRLDTVIKKRGTIEMQAMLIVVDVLQLLSLFQLARFNPLVWLFFSSQNSKHASCGQFYLLIVPDSVLFSIYLVWINRKFRILEFCTLLWIIDEKSIVIDWTVANEQTNFKKNEKMSFFLSIELNCLGLSKFSHFSSCVCSLLWAVSMLVVHWCQCTVSAHRRLFI